MNLPGINRRKRNLTMMLAFAVLLQTVLGIPGLSAGENGDMDAVGDEAQHASLLALDQSLIDSGESDTDDECREPCELANCDCAFCCQGGHQSVLAGLIELNDRPTSSWLMPTPKRSPSCTRSTIHRPPIA